MSKLERERKKERKKASQNASSYVSDTYLQFLQLGVGWLVVPLLCSPQNYPNSFTSKRFVTKSEQVFLSFFLWKAATPSNFLSSSELPIIKTVVALLKIVHPRFGCCFFTWRNWIKPFSVIFTWRNWFKPFSVIWSKIETIL